MSEIVLRASSLSKTYQGPAGSITVLAGADIEVRDRQMVCITGPSGSGKTTLLGCLGGLVRPEKGRVEILGQDIWALSDSERAVLRRDAMSFVFQSGNLFPYLTAAENAAISLILKGTKAGEAVRRASEALSAIGLGERLRHYPGKLSGGEQQRVALARAQLASSKVLFADEPTGNLDEENAKRVGLALAELSRTRCAVVVVSHNPLFWELSDTTLHLKGGRLEVSST